MTSISHPRRTDDTAMHHHPHGPGRTLEPSSGKAPATNHNHRGYSSQLQQQTSQPYTNQKDMGTTLAGTTQGSSGTSSTLTVLKRGDACFLLDHLRSPFCFPLLLGQTLNFFADHLHSLCLLHLPLPPHDLTNHILSQTPMWSMRPTQEIALCLRYARNG
jgi:hypothetical protein